MKEEQVKREKMLEKMRHIEKMQGEFENDQIRLQYENKLEHERRELKVKEVFF